jgi:hypothetical protein
MGLAVIMQLNEWLCNKAGCFMRESGEGATVCQTFDGKKMPAQTRM